VLKLALHAPVSVRYPVEHVKTGRRWCVL